MKFYFKIHFETFIIFILFLQGLKMLSWKSYILSEMSLLSCDKVSCSGAGSVGVGGCLLSRSWGETTTSSLFTWYYWSLRGWSRPTISLVLLSSLLGRNNLHTLSLFDCPREKKQRKILIKRWVESCHLMSRVETIPLFAREPPGRRW